MTNYGVKLDIQVTPDTKPLDNILQSTPGAYDDAAMDGAEKGAELVRRGIETGRGEWPPLSIVTIDRKGHDQILFDTGDMYNSIHAEKAGTGQAVYLTDTPYAPIHEFGLLASREPNPVPRRAFFAPTTVGNELQEIADAVTDRLMMLYNMGM